MLRDTRQRVLVVSQMHAVVDTAVADDIDGQDAVFVGLGDGEDDGGLVGDGRHGVGVVARGDDEIAEGAVADVLAGDEEVHGDVAHSEAEDGGVGD